MLASSAQNVSGYAGRCAKRLWPSGKTALSIWPTRISWAEPNSFMSRNGSAERFRTSGGKAAGEKLLKQRHARKVHTL